ncbi:MULTISPECIES: LptF/LptG family permease [unclassified Leeuwenhoekiella]|uniref:LptF/LptG family permease n=1 Tax=unclassified Leeuwenhoekiella TaxID=2615029 RepID=UPI000C4EA1CE|nr:MULTISPECIES: LptF/LptG family permease [unclassified Leeuwenhoekiella]MAW95620.1 permease [Leeuwenhoekiella sp.]MBA82288.1 permease [Leeuwenhoekiella sp.]
MKILDRYILITFIKNFLSTFIILMFIFVLQTVWLYIKELAGKDLDLVIIVKFLLYFSPRLVTLVLPLTVLLTSIMTFGNFAENYEFAAMKSTGISLQRAMRSLTVFILILAGTSFLFANYVIPAAEFESLNLRRNIAQVKPAMAITKGQYNTIGESYVMKIADKEGENGQFLKDVIIYQKDPSRTGNFTVIKAREAELISAEGDNVLSLKLIDGNYYDEVEQKDYSKQRREPFVKSYFETYTINIDLSELDNVDMDEKSIDNAYTMLTVAQLNDTLVDISKNYSNYLKSRGTTELREMQLRPLDTSYLSNIPVDTTRVVEDELIKNFSLSSQAQVLRGAETSVKNNITAIKGQKTNNQVKIKTLSKYEIALHEKFVLAFGCVILFFVGAPLGAIIRKGGLGLPIVIGVALFLTYHFIGIFAKNSAEDGSVSAWLASWLSTLILFPLGVYLTYRATTDQGLFDLEGFLDPIKKLFNKKDPDAVDPEQPLADFDLTNSEKAILKTKNQRELEDIVANYEQYGYSEKFKEAAETLLKTFK